MTTEFGKFLRRYRINNDLTLRAMALDMEISAAYLSAMELGKRAVPDDFIAKLAENYCFTKVELKEAEIAMINSQSSIEIDLHWAGNLEKQTMFAFARKIQDLGSDKFKKIQDILDSED